MRAIAVERPGGPEMLRQVEAPDPEPGPEDVVVRVLATGVCYHDLLDRAGKIPGAGPGRILGHEVAGEVVAVGTAVRDLEPGRRVVLYHRLACGSCRWCLAGRHDLCRRSAIVGSEVDGGYAEYVKVPARNAIPLPEGLDPRSGALASCPVGTSVRAVIGVADVRPGDRVLVTGASGGLGLHQIQVAKAVGAWVVGITGSEAKVEAIRAAGADEVVVGDAATFAGDVWALTGRTGVDVVMENVVSGTLQASLRCLAQGGTAVVLGNIEATDVAVDPGLIIGRRLRIVGSGNPTFEDVRRALHLMAIGAVVPRIAEVVPFEAAAQAHAAIEERRTVGRVVMSGWR